MPGRSFTRNPLYAVRPIALVLGCVSAFQAAPARSDSAISQTGTMHGARTAVSPNGACLSGGSYLWSNLETCGWPGPANTGPDLSQCPGGVLVDNGGAPSRQINITTPGTVISCQNITGSLEIYASNVMIKNSVISADGGGVSATGAVVVNDGASVTVDHVELYVMNHTHTCIFNAGLKGASFPHSLVANAVNCHGVNDGIFSWWWSQNSSLRAGSDFVIQNSYFHDFTENAANGHIDGFQTEGAQNGTIRHNTYKVLRVPGDVSVPGGGLNSAIAIWDDFNQTTPTGRKGGNFNVSNNLFAGGGFAIYSEDLSPGDGAPGDQPATGGNTLTNTTFSNNRFSNYFMPCIGGFGVWFTRPTWAPYFGGPTDGWHRSGNVVLETGLNVDSGNPSGCN